MLCDIIQFFPKTTFVHAINSVNVQLAFRNEDSSQKGGQTRLSGASRYRFITRV